MRPIVFSPALLLGALVLFAFMPSIASAQVSDTCPSGKVCRDGTFCANDTCYSSRENAERSCTRTGTCQAASGNERRTPACRGFGERCELYPQPGSGQGCCYPNACEIGPGSTSPPTYLCGGARLRR